MKYSLIIMLTLLLSACLFKIGLSEVAGPSSQIITHNIEVIDGSTTTSEFYVINEDVSGFIIQGSVTIHGDLQSSEPNNNNGVNRVCIASSNVCHKCSNCEIIN